MDRDSLLLLILQQSPRVTLLSADRFGKSSAWINFMRVRVDGELQPYAVCKGCNGVLKYEARRGTGSLLRHRCPHLRRNASGNPSHPYAGAAAAALARKKLKLISPAGQSSSEEGLPVIQQLFEYEHAVNLNDASTDADNNPPPSSYRYQDHHNEAEDQELQQDLCPSDPHFATKAIHQGQDPDQWTSKAVNPLICLSTTYKQEEPGRHAGYEYSRSGNPTRTCLEKCLASLENAKYCCCFASGLAATTCVSFLIKKGDHIICSDDVYGGTNRLLRLVISKYGIDTTFVDASDPDNVKNAIRENTKVVWIESPTNPTLKLADIQAISNIVKEANKDIIVAVDNTFMSSYFQQPLSLGADLVMHSLTKYMNGHSDVIMGCICVNNERLYEEIKFLQNAYGAVPSPFDCYMVNRGLKTLHLRMREHMKNGLAVAKFLEQHPAVERVLYPGLPSHPQHKLARRQCSGFTGMMSFYLRGGLSETMTFFQNLKIFIVAESLGGFESLAEHPAIMTHASVPEDQRKKLGISDNLIRLSVGLEEIDDLISDLDNALKKAIA